MNETDLRRVDLNLLVVFETLLAERHVGRAARRLSVSQSAVSHSLSRLRELFGDPLFARHPKGIEPTKYSIALGPQVVDVLNGARAILSASPVFDPNKSHRFTIGQTDGSISILVALTSHLRKTAPNIRLHVRPVDMNAVVGALDRQELDVAFAMAPPNTPARIARAPLTRIRHICVARSGHPAFKKARISADEFASLPHLAISPRGEVTNRVDDLLAKSGIRRNIVLTIPHFLAAPLIVARTDLVAIIDQSIVQLFTPDKRLKLFPLPAEFRPVSIDLLSASFRDKEPGLRWLRDQCIQVARSLTSSP